MRETAKSKAAKERAVEIARILAILHRWGIHTLGRFAALEKEAVGARKLTAVELKVRFHSVRYSLDRSTSQ